MTTGASSLRGDALARPAPKPAGAGPTSPKPGGNMDTVTLHFERDKLTKNTVRFQEVTAAGEPPRIGTLYVQKWAAGDDDKLTVTVEAS